MGTNVCNLSLESRSLSLSLSLCGRRAAAAATYLVPDELVQASVNADIARSHGLLSELLDLSDGLGGLLLEGAVGRKIDRVRGSHQQLLLQEDGQKRAPPPTQETNARPLAHHIHYASGEEGEGS